MTWIFCAGMIRSGSTLQFQLTSEMVERSGVGKRIEYRPELEFDEFAESYAEDSKLKVFKAHVCLGKLCELARSGEAKVIYSYRDIRDVAVSAMKKFDKTFSELIEQGWLDQAIIDFKKWSSMPNVLISKYEDFLFDIPNEVSRINSFLGNLVSTEDEKLIGSNFGLEKQRVRISNINKSVNRKIAASEVLFDPIQQLHHNHIDDGAIGKWAEKLNRTQIYFLNNHFQDWLVGKGYILPHPSLSNSSIDDLINLDELSHYWKLAIKAENNRNTNLKSALAEQLSLSGHMRDWAERTEALLLTERENAQKLQAWAERTEALLLTERENAQKLQAWAEQSDDALAKEREASKQLRIVLKSRRKLLMHLFSRKLSCD